MMSQQTKPRPASIRKMLKPSNSSAVLPNPEPLKNLHRRKTSVTNFC